MTDDRVLDYLRSRGQADVPPGLVTWVMMAVDDPVPSRSRFAAWMPAVAIATGVTAIAVVALLVGQGPNVGPGPSPATSSPTPSASVEPTIDDLGVALLDAVSTLRAAPGVEGRQQVEIDGTIGSATWFDWRPNGDQVVVQRQDLDVTETGWWMVPGGAPPTAGERIYTNIQAKVGDDRFFTNEDGAWQVAARDDTILAFGPGILDGSILPWRPLDGLVSWLPAESEARIQRGGLRDGGVEWQLEFQWLGAPLIQHWTIGPGGELRSWTMEREDRSVDPEGGFVDNATHAWLQFTITDGDPIQPPDVDAVPDAAAVGAPADLPLPPPPAGLDDTEQVVACEHPSGRYRVTLPEGWWTNRGGDAEETPPWEACELFGPEPFAVRPSGDRTWPDGVALSISWIDGGCIGSFLALLSSTETTVDGLPASVNEYAWGTNQDDPPGLYQYVIDLSDPGVDCELGGRFIMATTSLEMAGEYEENAAYLDRIMGGMEISPP